MKTLVLSKVIESKILLMRGQKAMLDRDLAQLYGVETRVLNQAVRRNIHRSPEDFMFTLTREGIMRISQIVTSSRRTGIETLKFSKSVMAFTEHGVSMLSSVLNSPLAVQVNIQIMGPLQSSGRYCYSTMICREDLMIWRKNMTRNSR